MYYPVDLKPTFNIMAAILILEHFNGSAVSFTDEVISVVQYLSRQFDVQSLEMKIG